MAKRGAKRTKGERERDLVEEAKLYFQGQTQQQIADAINASRPYNLTNRAIGHDLRQLRRQWHEESMVDIGQVKARDLAELRTVQSEAWRAWYASIGEVQEKTVTEGVNMRRGSTLETKTHKKIQTGDVRYLNVILRVEERIAKLFGLDAPQIHEINWRQQFEAAGIPADEAYEQFVAMIEQELSGQDSGTSGA